MQQTARLVRITSSALAEGHPHDVKSLKDAPNYSSTTT
jgi:IMP dehydrogenase